MITTIKLLFGAIIFWVMSNAFAAEQIEPQSSTILEIASVTIHKTNATPYVELRLCEECPLRLLPLAKDAQVNIDGQYITHSALSEGQKITGTIFITEQPITSVSYIVGK